jgi:DnaK suppressor protein
LSPAHRDEWDEADARGEVAPRPAFARTGSGWQVVEPLSTERLERARGALEERAAQLAADLATIQRQETPRDEGPRPQYGKRIGDHTSDALETRRNVAAADMLRAQQAEVERALAKLAEGTYGRCDSCGALIAPDRLEALPWAAECLPCRGARRR